MYAKHLCAEQLEVHSNDMAEIMRVNAAVGVHWVLSFLSADKKETYCLYEAPCAEAIREVARPANLPAGAVSHRIITVIMGYTAILICVHYTH